ncbi:MAG: DNA polymerase III subunit gamma/tau [Candidatus Marinimicrobia bacterium]|nr:DNA polymerase III subunit gamma/tau [Candidatus Neomarinimicrobiota bacterium]
MVNQDPAYIVSSLKYRPQTFEDVVGQDHVSRTLRNALLRQRLANGYIFTGPRGVGKTTSARILAKAINCENPSDGNPCNVCNHCKEITGGRSIDVLEVDGASTRGIDAIRELREVVKYPPANSNYRVYIIDEVHMLTKEAFNALLKTLEEPPPKVLFIFATTEPHKVPLTILSRCQRYDFRMISTETMVARLNMICNNEAIKIADEGLALIARKAAGSLRDALSLMDQVSAFAEEEASIELVRRVLGVLDASIYFDIFHHVASQSAESIITQANLLFSRGISITEFLNGLSEHIRNLLVVKVAGITDFLDVSDNDAKAYAEQVEYFEERDLLRMQTLVIETIREQRFVSNQLVSVELMLLKLVRSSRALDIDALLSGKSTQSRPRPAPKPVILAAVEADPKKEHSSEVLPSKGTVVVTESEPERVSREEPPPENQKIAENPPPVELELEIAKKSQIDDSLEAPAESDDLPSSTQQALSLDQLLTKWETFTENLGRVGKTTGAFMAEGTPSHFESGTLSITFAPEQKYHVQTLNKSIKDIQQIASETFGAKMLVKLIEKNGHKPKQRKEDEILSHPTSQHLLDIFDGEIIDD